MRKTGRWFSGRYTAVPLLAAALLAPAVIGASESKGVVVSGGGPVPGAVVTATFNGKTFTTVTNARGEYRFPDLTDGAWTVRVELRFFAPLTQTVTVSAAVTNTQWDLKVLPLSEAMAQAAVVAPASPATAPVAAAAAPRQGLLLNGSVNNAATSKYSLAQAFGNTRTHYRDLYNGFLHFNYNNSAFDARPFSLTGQEAEKPAYDQVTGILSLGGPIQIPHLLRHGPDFNLQYTWRRDNQSVINTGLVPTAAQHAQAAVPQAAALLALYPLPNVVGNTAYNFQAPVVNGTHLDSLVFHADKGFKRETLSGRFEFDSTRANSTNLFGFRDNTPVLDISTTINWHHRWNGALYSDIAYSFSRSRNEVDPFFANRTNIAGEAGFAGVNQDPANWGPPTLNFASGIVSLTDAQSARNRNETNEVKGSVTYYRGRHNFEAGADFRQQEFNYFTQPNPRGEFTFTGLATGSDFSDFLAGVPDSAQISFGNPDKYLRQPALAVYGNDDWRVQPDLTLNYGVRWEYEAPATELKNRLANIDQVDNFAAVTPVTAQAPIGPLSGMQYPRSLLRPDRAIVEPTFGLAWRPLPASSLLVRAGYSLRADTSIYSPIALSLAEQAPFARSISADNSTCPQTLANGPTACATNTADTFGIDPNYRRGYVQQWNANVQRDLPAAMQFNAWYTGNRGLNGMQQFLPNTYPVGGANPCPTCAVGFAYRTSTGSSNRQEGRVQLRRRLRSGFTATVMYTFSKSVDDDSVLGGNGPLVAGSTATPAAATTAQNWLDLHAERSLSSFNQKHLLNATFQYTTGMGLGGGTLLRGWGGRLYKEWTVASTIAAGSGIPLTPVYDAVVPGTGFAGSIRPDRTGAPLHSGLPAGYHLNPSAFAAPAAGQWGSAGRNSITGPSTFTLNTSVMRTFRLPAKTSFDFRIDATNLLNHVVFQNYITTINPSTVSPTFGLPGNTDAMRSLQVNATLRF